MVNPAAAVAAAGIFASPRGKLSAQLTEEECGRKRKLIASVSGLEIGNPFTSLFHWEKHTVLPEFLFRAACRRPTFPPGEG